MIGAVERGGKVVASVARDLSGKGILRFFRDAASPDGTLLMTDAYAGYRRVGEEGYHHAVINHSESYIDSNPGEW